MAFRLKLEMIEPREVAHRVHRARLMLARRLHAMGMVFRSGSGLAGAGLVAAVIVAGIVARRRKQATAVHPSIIRRAGCLPVATLAMFRT